MSNHKIACAYCDHYINGSYCQIISRKAGKKIHTSGAAICDQFHDSDQEELMVEIAIEKKKEQMNYSERKEEYNGVLSKFMG